MGFLDWVFGAPAKTAAATAGAPRAAPARPAAGRQYTGAFAEDRHRPPGVWTQFSLVEEVVGIQHRKADAIRFANVAGEAEARRQPYGLELRPDPDNLHDPKAVRVYGVVSTDKIHIGFLPRALAAEVTDELIAKGLPYAAELYKVWRADGYIEIKLVVLGPKGHSHSARRRRS